MVSDTWTVLGWRVHLGTRNLVCDDVVLRTGTKISMTDSLLIPCPDTGRWTTPVRPR